MNPPDDETETQTRFLQGKMRERRTRKRKENNDKKKQTREKDVLLPHRRMAPCPGSRSAPSTLAAPRRAVKRTPSCCTCECWLRPAGSTLPGGRLPRWKYPPGCRTPGTPSGSSTRRAPLGRCWTPSSCWAGRSCNLPDWGRQERLVSLGM